MWTATFVCNSVEYRNPLQKHPHPPMVTVGFEAADPAEAMVTGINMLKDLLRSTTDWTLHSLSRA